MSKRILSLICITATILNLTLASCDTKESADKIEYYTLEGSASLFDCFIDEYNKSCDVDNMIQVTEFSDEKALSNAVSTEIMAGGGPDIISLSTMAYSSISFEKLLQQGGFADIKTIINNDSSDNKINLNDYNEKAIKACNYDDKLVLMPISYMPNFLICSQDKADEYINNQSLDYKTVVSVNESLSKYSFFEYEDEYESLLYDYIDENVNLYNNTMSFDTEEFINTAKGIKNLMNNSDNKEGLCTSSDTFSLLSTCWNFIQKIDNGEVPVLLNKPTNDGEYTAEIREAVAVNGNTNAEKQQKILDFIKYIMSDDVQNDFSGAKTKKFDEATNTGLYYPVKKASFDKLFTTAKNVPYGENKEKINSKQIEQIEGAINKISSYKIAMAYDYYNGNVINETVSEFMNDNLSDKEFVNQLEAKTKIYLEE